jgi:hypothetical protein
MEEFIEPEYATRDSHVLESNTNFYTTIIAIRQREYPKALAMITELRSTLSENIGFSLSQNYSRAKRGMVSMQVLAEIEEVIDYSQLAAKAEISDTGSLSHPRFDANISVQSSDIASKKALLLNKWKGRFKWVPKEVKVYRQILGVHTLVADPIEDLDSWYTFVTAHHFRCILSMTYYICLGWSWCLYVVRRGNSCCVRISCDALARDRR